MADQRIELGIQALKTHYAAAGKSGSQEEKQAIEEYVRQQRLKASTYTQANLFPDSFRLDLSKRTGTADAFARQQEEDEIKQGVNTLRRYYAGQGKTGTYEEKQAIEKYISDKRLEFKSKRPLADAKLLGKRGGAAAPENPFANYKGPSIDEQLRAEGLLPSDPRYQQRASQMMRQFINRKEAWDKEIQRAKDMKFSLSTPTVYFKFENLHGEQAMQDYLRGQGLRQNTYDWERERESVQRQMRQGQQFLASLYQAKQEGGNLGRGIAIGNVANIAQKQYAKIKSEYERETRALIEERQKDTRQLSRAIREELEAKLKARLDSLRRKAQKELDEAYRKYSRISSSPNGTFLSGALYGIANPDVNPQFFRATTAAPPALQEVTGSPVGAPDPTMVLRPLGGESHATTHTEPSPRPEPRRQVFFATAAARIAPEVVTATTAIETAKGTSCGGERMVPAFHAQVANPCDLDQLLRAALRLEAAKQTMLNAERMHAAGFHYVGPYEDPPITMEKQRQAFEEKYQNAVRELHMALQSLNYWRAVCGRQQPIALDCEFRVNLADQRYLAARTKLQEARLYITNLEHITPKTYTTLSPLGTPFGNLPLSPPSATGLTPTEGVVAAEQELEKARLEANEIRAQCNQSPIPCELRRIGIFVDGATLSGDIHRPPRDVFLPSRRLSSIGELAYLYERNTAHFRRKLQSHEADNISTGRTRRYDSAATSYLFPTHILGHSLITAAERVRDAVCTETIKDLARGCKPPVVEMFGYSHGAAAICYALLLLRSGCNGKGKASSATPDVGLVALVSPVFTGDFLPTYMADAAGTIPPFVRNITVIRAGSKSSLGSIPLPSGRKVFGEQSIKSNSATTTDLSPPAPLPYTHELIAFRSRHLLESALLTSRAGLSSGIPTPPPYR